MAMGTRRQLHWQEELWYRRDLAEAPGHPYYRLTEVLDDSAVLNHETLVKVGDWIVRLG